MIRHRFTLKNGRDVLSSSSGSRKLQGCANLSSTYHPFSTFSAAYSSPTTISGSTRSTYDFILEKKFIRTEKRSVREQQYRKDTLRNHELFRNQRSAIVNKFSDQESIETFFSSEPHFQHSSQALSENEVVNTEQELVNSLNNGHNLSYFSPIKHSIMCLATHLINSVVVEMNLRRQLLKDDPTKQMPSTFFFRENVLDESQRRDMKQEIFEILASLSKNRPTTDKSGPHFPAKVSSREPIFMLIEEINQNDLKSIFNHEMKTSDAFNDIEFWRFNFTYFKSGQYLNYEHSDTFSSIQNLNLVNFASPVVENSEYIRGFDQVFEEFKLNKDNNVLANLQLMLGLSQVLLGNKQYTPDFGIFSNLLERLTTESTNNDLYNLQGIVYHSLPAHEHRQTILATMKSAKKPINRSSPLNMAPRFSYHFKHLVQSCPNILSVLMQYQVSRNDSATFIELLNFFRLQEVSEYERSLSRTPFTGFVSKSRFASSRATTLATLQDANFFDISEPVFIDVSTLYKSISGCLDLKQFEYIDLLLSKLVLFYVKNIEEGSSKVALSFGSQPSNFALLISQTDITPSVLSLEIFTKDLFLLLLRACRDARDAGRLLWLIPHLDLYIETNLRDPENINHINRIKDFNRNSLLNGTFTHISEFQVFEANSSFDTEFIQGVFQTLRMFGIDGKLHTYNKHFDFENTVPEVFNEN